VGGGAGKRRRETGNRGGGRNSRCAADLLPNILQCALALGFSFLRLAKRGEERSDEQTAVSYESMWYVAFASLQPSFSPHPISPLMLC